MRTPPSTRAHSVLAVSLCCAGFPMRSGADPGDLVTPFSGTVHDFALNPSNAELYATTDTAVLVVDTASLTEIGRVSLGNAPRGVAVSPDGTRLYVATSAAPELVVVDVATLRAIDAIALPRAPFDVEAGRDGRVYATPGSGGGYGGIMQVDATTGPSSRSSPACHTAP